MGDSLRREFSMSPVDTGQMTPPVPIPGMTPTQGGAPQSPALGTEQSGPPPGLLTGMPTQIPGQPIHRPSFLQSFLANLGPSLAGGVLASGPNGEQNFGTALAGGLAVIQSYQEKQFQRGQQIQQAQRQAAQQASEQALQGAQTQRLQQLTPLEVQEQTLSLDNLKNIRALANDSGQQSGIFNSMSQTLGPLSPDEQAILDSA